MKLVLLFAATLLVTIVAAGELFPTVDVSEGLDREIQLAGDTPVRQSQRERASERAARREAAAEAEFAPETSLIEASAEATNPPGPKLNRLTGAAKTYHPNDQMCVLCQFLVQRTQLDMAHFNAVAGFVGAKTAGTGGAANAATGGADAGEKAGSDDAFIEIGSSESADWEAEDAEDAELMEIAAKQELAEAAGDWDAVAALEKQAHTISSGSNSDSDSDSEDEESDESESESESESEAPAVASLSETAASVVAQGLTSVERAEMEAVMNEVHDEAVADSVQKQIAEGMEVTPVLVETADEAESDADEEDMIEEEVTADMISNGERKSFLNALSEKFDSELTLSSDEVSDLRSTLNGEDSTEDATESSFQSPIYNADGSSEAITGADQIVEAQTADSEDLALLQIDESDTESDGSDESDEESDSADAGADAGGMFEENIEFIEIASTEGEVKPRRYARVMHSAEVLPVAPEAANMHGEHAVFLSTGGVARMSSAGADGRRKIGIANSPRRFRLADALNGRPRWNRFDPTVQAHPNAQRQQAREMWHRLMQMTYDRLEGYCSTRLPEQFTPFCRPLLRRFRVVAEGIRYGDRPNQICMRTKFCPRGSYVRRSPHNVFKHVSPRH